VPPGIEQSRVHSYRCPKKFLRLCWPCKPDRKGLALFKPTKGDRLGQIDRSSAPTRHHLNGLCAQSWKGSVSLMVRLSGLSSQLCSQGRYRGINSLEPPSPRCCIGSPSRLSIWELTFLDSSSRTFSTTGSRSAKTMAPGKLLSANQFVAGLVPQRPPRPLPVYMIILTNPPSPPPFPLTRPMWECRDRFRLGARPFLNYNPILL